LVYGSDGVVKCQVTHGKLLVTEITSVKAAIEGQIVDEATRAALNEYALMLRA
jgi:hypothetical protein